MNNQVLAKVGKVEITTEEMMNTIRSMPKEQMNQFGQLEGRKQLLQEMVSRELLYLDAKDQNMEAEEGFLKQLEEAKHFLLKQYAVQKLIGSINVTDEEVKQYYENNQQQFVTPPQVRAKHILVKDEVEARRLLNEIKNGADFDEVAKEHSACPSKEKGGDLGFFGPKQMVPEFDQVVFSMEVGELSHVVKTQFGYHIIRLEEKKEGGTQTFEQAEQNIKQFLLRQKQNQKYVSYTEELKKKYPVEIHEDALQ